MKTTEQHIAALVEDMTPRALAPEPLVLFMRWFLAMAIYMAVLLCFFGIRDDLPLKLHTALFSAELSSLVAIVILSGIAASILSFPDMYQKKWLVYTPLFPLLFFLGIIYMEWLQDNPPSPKPVHGIECLFCISGFTLFPAVAMIRLLRKQASTRYYMTGAIALIAACSIGCVTLRISEKTDSITHLIEWHYLPVIGFALIGIIVGRKFLKW
jgi:hypothetical protein